MAYCTQSDILDVMDEDVLIQLTDDDDAGLVDSGIVDQAIAAADALIDSYCGTRYEVPFATVPELVKDFSVIIAIYKLYGRRKGAPDDVRTRYNDAVRMLKDISKGLATLGADAPAEDSDSGPEATTVKSDRIFSMGRSSDSSTGTLDNY